MTLEEKAKEFDASLERAKKLRETCDSTAVIGWCEYLFPELKESEDEKIRKELIAVINDLVLPDEQRTRFLSWLEKQGESTGINPSEFDLRLNKLLKQFETLPKEELVNSLNFYLNVVQNDGTYKEQGNYEFNGKITPRKSKGTLKTLIDEVEQKELSQSQVTKKSDKDGMATDIAIKALNHNNVNDSYCKENCKGYQETGKCYADWDCEAKRKAEQNLVWSEEDDEQVNIITNIVQAHCGKLIDCRASLKWLELLKQRFKQAMEE